MYRKMGKTNAKVSYLCIRWVWRWDYGKIFTFNDVFVKTSNVLIFYKHVLDWKKVQNYEKKKLVEEFGKRI